MAEDLQSAGVQAPEADPSALLRALSMGQSPQSPLMPAAAMLSGFGAGMRGQPNPVIGQMIQQQDADRRQQVAMFGLMDQVNRARQRKQEFMRDLLHSLPDDNPEVYDFKVRGLMKMAKDAGADVPQNLQEGLLRKRLTKDQMKEIIGFTVAGVPAEDITRLVPGSTAQDVSSLQGIAQNDRFLKTWGIPSLADMNRTETENKSKDLKILLESYGLHGDKPQTQFVLQYAMKTYGKPFNELSLAERQDVITKSGAMDQGKISTLARQALEEFGKEVGVSNPELATPDQRERAVNLFRAKRQKEMLNRGAIQGQLSVTGRTYANELNRVSQNRDKVRTLDDLVNRMDRLIDEGQALGLTNNPRAINAIEQELRYWTAGPKSKAAQWYQARQTVDAQFATVAQSIEGITGNRLAQQSMNRALHYHPKMTDPYTVQKRVLSELKKARDDTKAALDDDQARTMRQMESAAGQAGVPFVLGQPSGPGWSAQPEEEP